MREGWEYKKLGEVATLINGFAFQSAMFQKAGLPIVRISNIQDDKITSDFVYFNRGDYNIDFEKYEVLYGDILIAMSGATTGKVGINYNDEVLYLNQRVGKIVPRENIIHRYLFYYLKTNAAKSLSIAQGVAQPNLSTQQINSFVLPVPPLSEQQRIVSELDLLSSIIEKKKAQLKEYDQLAQSIFYDMFGDPVTNEKGWEKASLSKMGLLARGVSKHRPRNAPELLGGTMPLIQTGDVSNADFYIRNYNSTYSELGVSQSKIWKAGTLCITIAATIGKCAILSFDACFPDSVVGFTVNNKLCNNEYVFFIFKCLQSILEENAPSVAQKNINLKVLNDLELPLPPLPLQQSFASKIEAIERQKALIQQSIAEVQMLFDSRMDDWFA